MTVVYSADKGIGTNMEPDAFNRVLAAAPALWTELSPDELAWLASRFFDFGEPIGTAEKALPQSVLARVSLPRKELGAKRDGDKLAFYAYNGELSRAFDCQLSFRDKRAAGACVPLRAAATQN